MQNWEYIGVIRVRGYQIPLHLIVHTCTQTNTFQGIVITDGNKTYAVYTYHCDDVEWSDGSVIGFNAGGSYYANHPLSDSLAARDIDCVHSPESEWNNVVYDVNPNGTTIYGPPVLSGRFVCFYFDCYKD